MHRTPPIGKAVMERIGFASYLLKPCAVVAFLPLVGTAAEGASAGGVRTQVGKEYVCSQRVNPKTPGTCTRCFTRTGAQGGSLLHGHQRPPAPTASAI